MALNGTKALEKWCQIVTDGYSGVRVLNMSTSWRNGLGFCAIIHHFRPELIDFEVLDPDDVYSNNELAFSIAEQHLGIPSLLDPQDMVECELIDRLSILTYLSQFYQAFHGATAGSKSSKPSSVTNSPAKTKLSGVSRVPLIGRKNEPCKVCGNGVFILERLNVSGKLLHRTCFKCARCQAQLSIANYYETESGDYCCDVCPDEEISISKVAETNKKIVEEHLETPEEDPADSSDDDSEDDDGKKDKTSESSLPESMQKEPIEEDKADNDANNNDQADDAQNNNDENDDDDDDDEKLPLPECDQQSKEVGSLYPNLESLRESLEDVTDAAVKSDAETDRSIEPDDSRESLDEIHHGDDHELTDQAIEHTNNEVIKEDTEDLQKVPDEPLEQEPVDNVNDEVAQDAGCDEAVQQSYPDNRNPFDDEEEEEEEDIKVKEDNVNTNPFGSDFEDSETEESKPTVTVTENAATNPAPPKPPRVSLNPFGSDFEDDDESPLKAPVSPALSSSSRARKKRQAPLPPGKTTPTPSPRNSIMSSPVAAPRTSLRPVRPPPPRPPPPSADVSKSCKDRDNINRRSQALMETSSMSDASSVMSMSTTTSASTTTDPKSSIVLMPMSPNKSSIEGQWKRKKGPAPPRPIPAKRQVKKLPRKAVNQELHDIEVKQQELERQGVKLEEMIRGLTIQNDAARTEAGLENNDRDSLGPEAEDLIIQMFDLVNEKNDLFRRQTVLLYMKREHRLEEEHANTEHQIRILMAKPDALRTDDDRVKEEQLIERLMTIVSQRNEIVDCLEMDRVRALEEDESIEIHMEEYAAVKPQEDDVQSKKKKKKKEKKKKKKDKHYDADKDIDTKEFPQATSPSKTSPFKKRLTLKSPLSGAASSLSDKEKAKKLKKKLMSSLKPISSKKDAL